MAKQAAPIEVNNLSRGLITEANALTFPDSASVDEVNFRLSRDGSRKRRYGIEVESGNTPLATGFIYSEATPSIVSTFLWENVGGDTTREILVVQFEDHVAFFQTSSTAITNGLIEDPKQLTDKTVGQTLYGNLNSWLSDFPGTDVNIFTSSDTGIGNVPFGFASVNGNLIIATGGRNLYKVSADLSLDTFPVLGMNTYRLEIRDLFGVPAIYDQSIEGGNGGNIDLTDPVYISKRPIPEGLPGGSDYSSVDVSIPSDVLGYRNQPGVKDLNSTSTNKWSPTEAQGYEFKQFYTQPENGIIRLVFRESTTPWIELTVRFTFPDSSTNEVVLENKNKSSEGRYEIWGEKSLSNKLIDNRGSGVSFRIVFSNAAVSSPYVYNLRNQSFALKRLPKTGTTKRDPISEFSTVNNTYPSMSDTVSAAFYNNVEDSNNKTAERFHAEDLITSQQGSYPAPKGYFIIDALTRSLSRRTRWLELVQDQEYDENEIADLPEDSTEGGARAVAEYGGRVWYGGFSEGGEPKGGSTFRMDSYLLYSQLVKSDSAIGRCYQAGDPTSTEEPELLDTDGGFLKLDGAYGIRKLVPLGNSLVVFANNGVWAISGSDGNYFTPTTPRVQKVTDKGCLSPMSIVVVDTSVVYWGKDGIYAVGVTEAESYELSNLTENSIQTLYNEIPYTDKLTSVGEYDTYASKIVWSVYNTIARTQQTMLLELQLTTGAFTKHLIGDGVDGRTLVGPVRVTPYTIEASDIIVVVGTAEVIITDAGVDTTVVNQGKKLVSRTGAGGGEDITDIKYLVLENVGDETSISFGEFTNTEFKDWGEVDAAAYMVTGYVSGGDFQRNKQMPYVTFHFERTEDGFEQDVDGNLTPTSPSSCLVQAQWEWANSVNSGRWGREFQAYRYKGQYMPANVSDPYDYGYSTIVTKNKLRGKGKVLSLKLSTEEGKDCRILGWSAIMGVNSHV